MLPETCKMSDQRRSSLHGVYGASYAGYTACRPSRQFMHGSVAYQAFGDGGVLELQAAIGQPRQLECMDLQLSCMNLQPCEKSMESFIKSKGL